MSIDRTFAALASGPRRQILAYLSEAELTAGEIASRFAMTAPAVSRHLSLLEAANLVQSTKQGQYVRYRLNRDNVVSTLTDFAFSLCPVGSPLKRESAQRAKQARTVSATDPATD